jgi:hypothetical protein
MSVTHADSKCAMCGKAIIIGDDVYNDKNQQDSRHQQGSSTATIIVEQIDGSCYTFDTADCALMFKKFKDVYGSKFVENELLS